MSDPTPFKAYFQELHAIAQQGDAREESFYPALAWITWATGIRGGSETETIFGERPIEWV